MCLEIVHYTKTKRKILRKLPENIVVYRGVKAYRGRYYPLFNRTHCPFRVGLNQTVPIEGRYPLGYHSILDKKDARQWSFAPQRDWSEPSKKQIRIIRAKVPKKSIVATGKQEGVLCIVSSQIIMPKFRKPKK
jgi:hypothetical protein